jgi:hypothetical protein
MKSLVNQLREHFGDRYTLIEEFLNVHVKVLDFTDEDKTWLRNFFDSTLDPNILIALTEWFNFVEVVALGDIPLMRAERKDRDVYPRGLRYDGRIRYDHGQEIRFDGSGTYNGALKYRTITPKQGTVLDFVKIAESYNGVRTYGGEIPYTGDTEVWAPEAIANPATYGSGKDDDALGIQINQRVQDQAELYPTYDGCVSYGGVLTYGGIQPDMVDEARIEITQRVAHLDAGVIADETSITKIYKQDQDIYPSGLRYDGRIKYDHGIAPCYDGKTRYNGEIPYKKIIPKKGTIIDSDHGDIPNPATYQSASGEQDALNAAVRLQLFEEQVAIQPRFDGKVWYGGAVTYAGNKEEVI